MVQEILSNNNSKWINFHCLEHCFVIIIGMIRLMNKAIKKITTLVFASLTVAACVPVDQPVAQIKSEIPAISELQVLPTSLPVKTPQEFTESALTELPKGIPITFWHPWSGELANLAAEMVDEFNRSNVSEIVVNVEAHSDELVFIEDLNQTFLNGQPPEVIASPGYYLRFLEDKGFSIKEANFSKPTSSLKI